MKEVINNKDILFTRWNMVSEAQKLSDKYNIFIELDSAYTAERFSIKFYKSFKIKKPEYITLSSLNNNRLLKFYKKYIFSELIEIGENIMIKPS